MVDRAGQPMIVEVIISYVKRTNSFPGPALVFVF